MLGDSTYATLLLRLGKDKTAAKEILAHFEHIADSINAEAELLVHRARAINKENQGEKKRLPFAVLTTRYRVNQFGPTLLWVRPLFSKDRVNVNKNFTREIPGRRNNKYRKTIFNRYEPYVAEQLWEVECEAAELRGRVATWRMFQKFLREESLHLPAKSSYVREEYQDVP